MRCSPWSAWAVAFSVVKRRRLGQSLATKRRATSSRGSRHELPPPPLWTVEWSPSVEAVRSDLLPVAPQWVFPDLPNILGKSDREVFLENSLPHERIETLAVGAFSDGPSLIADPRCQRILADQHNQHNHNEGNKLLLVGGNSRKAASLTTPQAATILADAFPSTHQGKLWGISDPNDPSSPQDVQTKLQAGITGFLTQPLLSSTAWRTLEEDYPSAARYVVGLAMPRTAKGLQFWCHQLLGRPELVVKDPLFQSHLAYFSQPHVVPLAWSGRELQSLCTLLGGPGCPTTRRVIDGVHFMPFGNTGDLVTLFRSLSAQASSLEED